MAAFGIALDPLHSATFDSVRSAGDVTVVTREAEEYSEAVRSFKDYFGPHVKDKDSEASVSRAYGRLLEGQDATLRMDINLDDLRTNDAPLCRSLLEHPITYLRAAQEGYRACLLENNVGTTEELESIKVRVGVKGSFGPYAVSPRTLTARFLGKLVSLEGIVTKMTVVRPKLVRSVHYVPSKKHHAKEREYRDATSLEGLPTSSIIPTKDEENNLMELEFGLSTYTNHQKLTIQEMPERAPLGQLPRSVEVICEDDLVDRVKPGDRVQCSGIYRAVGGSSDVSELSGAFRTSLIGNSIQSLGRDVAQLVMTPDDIVNIKNESARKDVFERMARSLAPSIYGHEYIKKAVLLLLLGGVEKVLDNGAHLRGDVNILIVGDPSTAKSQMLRFVLNVAPLAISTTGRGSTGVGLTAAVTSDADTGERRLEAGAMVLADRGVVLIDEFDKMGDGDRVAIHEVMEQQTVTIAKAGIHASLNARCSVVAAANPIYGMYDKTLSPQKNIGLPDSLLSRFDLLFVVLDSSDAAMDRRVAEHVLKMHRYQQPGMEGKPLSLFATGVGARAPHDRHQQRRNDRKRRRRQNNGGSDDEDDDDDDDDEDDDDDNNGDGDEEEEEMTSPVLEKYDPTLHPIELKDELYSTEFIKKYINYAKLRVKPVLCDESAHIISEEYEELRQDQITTKTLPITPRCLETLIRLATAHAKVRLSPVVEKQDCLAARELLRFALYNDTQAAEKRREEEAAAAAAREAKRRARFSKRRGGSESESEDDDPATSSSSSGEEEEKEENTNPKTTTTKTSGEPAEVAAPSSSSSSSSEGPPGKRFHVDEEERLAFFTKSTATVMGGKEEIHVDDLLVEMNKLLVAAKADKDSPLDGRWPAYGAAEASSLLELMEQKNQVLFRDSIVYKI